MLYWRRASRKNSLQELLYQRFAIYYHLFELYAYEAVHTEELEELDSNSSDEVRNVE